MSAEDDAGHVIGRYATRGDATRVLERVAPALERLWDPSAFVFALALRRRA